MPRNDSSKRRQRKVRAKITPSAVHRKRTDIDYLRAQFKQEANANGGR